MNEEFSRTCVCLISIPEFAHIFSATEASSAPNSTAFVPASFNYWHLRRPHYDMKGEDTLAPAPMHLGTGRWTLHVGMIID